MAASSTSAVLAALIGNAFLTVLKFTVWTFSGSGAMFSEAIHTLADTSNQALLLIGIRRSERPAGPMFAYGYGAERYLFAILSAVGIFVLGCGVTVYHGVHSYLHPPEELTIAWWLFAVLGISFLVDGFVFIKALRAVRGQMGGRSVRSFLRSITDPTAFAVLLEDFAACVGVLIALAGIVLAMLTNNTRWDALASILIGLMLGGIAIWIALQNRTLLVGRRMPPEIRESVLAYMESQPSVERVVDMRSRVMGANHFKMACDVDFNGRFLGQRLGPWVHERAGELESAEACEQFASEFGERVIDQLSLEVDRLEEELRKIHPELEHLDLEADG